jgi:hypothetical protein
MAPEPPPQEGIRTENEKRRQRMEELQREAELAERKRREIRMQELLKAQEEGIRRSEEERRKLWTSPSPR